MRPLLVVARSRVCKTYVTSLIGTILRHLPLQRIASGCRGMYDKIQRGTRGNSKSFRTTCKSFYQIIPLNLIDIFCQFGKKHPWVLKNHLQEANKQARLGILLPSVLSPRDNSTMPYFPTPVKYKHFYVFLGEILEEGVLYSCVCLL